MMGPQGPRPKTITVLNYDAERKLFVIQDEMLPKIIPEEELINYLKENVGKMIEPKH